LLIFAIEHFSKFLGEHGARLHSTLIHHPLKREVNQDAVQPCTGIMFIINTIAQRKDCSMTAAWRFTACAQSLNEPYCHTG